MRLTPRRAIVGSAVVAVAAAVAVIVTTATTQSPSTRHSTTETRPASTGDGAAAVVAGDAAWPTYHHDAAHSGTAAASPALLPIHAAWTSAFLDGDIYGEPLAADGVLLVATTSDTVYGLDPGSGAVRWRTHVATPVALAALPCGNVDPLGILSTPVVDPGLHRLFVVAEERTGSGIQHELVGLDTRSGSIATRQVVDPPGMNVVTQEQRSSLVLDHDRVIVAFGGLYGDCGRYSGWLVSAGEDGSSPLVAFHTPGNGGAFWSPGGPIVDSDGAIFVTSGNGSSTTSYDEGNSVLKLSPALALVDSFAVSGWASDNAADADLGSAGPILVGQGLVFQAGKRHTGYLLDAGHLGGIGGQVFAGPTGCASFGAQAADGADLYVACMDGGLRKFRIDAAHRSFSAVWISQGPGDGPPVVGGGAIWSEDWRTGTLYAYDPATGHPLASTATGPADHFVTPSIIGGTVVVAAKRQVHAFVGPDASTRVNTG